MCFAAYVGCFLTRIALYGMNSKIGIRLAFETQLFVVEFGNRLVYKNTEGRIFQDKMQYG